MAAILKICMNSWTERPIDSKIVWWYGEWYRAILVFLNSFDFVQIIGENISNQYMYKLWDMWWASFKSIKSRFRIQNVSLSLTI